MAGLAVLAIGAPLMQDAFDLSPTTQVSTLGVGIGVLAGAGIWLVNGRTAQRDG
jgi:hypothetical protein